MSYSRSSVLENERESGTEKFSLENNPLRRVHIWSLNELRFKGFVIDEGFELTTYFIIDNQNVLPLHASAMFAGIKKWFYYFMG